MPGHATRDFRSVLLNASFHKKHECMRVVPVNRGLETVYQ